MSSVKDNAPNAINLALGGFIYPSVDKTYTFEYNIGGNIVKKTEYAYTTEGLGEELVAYEYTYANAWKDQLTSFAGKDIIYDYAGNPIVYMGNRLFWNRARLLAGVAAEHGCSVITMLYDANGIRTSKTKTDDYVTTETNFVYDNEGRLRTETEGEFTRHYIYSHQGIEGYEENGERFIYRKNIFGDITAIYKGATKVAEYTYDAWGNCTVTYDTNSIGARNPMRYRGYYWDKDLKMYYLMTRYYDPKIGRFINADTPDYLDHETLGGLNLYAYCNSNPVMNIDPSGHEPITLGITGFLLMAFCAFAMLSLSLTVATTPNTNIKTDDIPNNIFDTDVDSAYGMISGLIALYVAGLVAKKWYDSEEKHHIVAKKDPRAWPSRLILSLEDVNIDINDERNLVSVKKGYHRVLHTNLYYKILNFSMITSYVIGGKEGVEWLLVTYQKELGGLK